ncbi:MAG: M23 family metallopeptidase [Spirochaetaceae bacterium]|jgi:hypothetical protein|nr:M23 family metallopeptidase [Spirochaetaceae bacterium]
MGVSAVRAEKVRRWGPRFLTAGLKPVCGLLRFGALALLFTAPLGALEWPADANAVINKNFGWNDGSLPSLGDSFLGAGPVSACAQGELIIISNEDSSRISGVPSPLGSYVAINHEDGLVSIYAHLEDVDFLPQRLDSGVIIANSGKTGCVDKNGFYFSFFDRKEKRYVNPSLLIPPMEDGAAPSIRSVKLQNSSGSLIDLSQTRNLKQGDYTINVHAQDSRTQNSDGPTAPFRITTSINGAETGALVNETFFVIDGELMMKRNENVSARRVFAPYPAVEAGEIYLSRGQANILITVQDISGNISNAQYRVFIE